MEKSINAATIAAKEEIIRVLNESKLPLINMRYVLADVALQVENSLNAALAEERKAQEVTADGN